MTNSQAGREEAKDQEGLCAGLVGDIVLDGIRDEVLDLEEYLRQSSNDVSADEKLIMAGLEAGFARKRSARHMKPGL